MPRDVLITPATGLVDFKDDSGNVDAYIQLDTTGNLNINNAGGNLIVGNTSSNVYIGNGSTSTDVIFEQNGAIRALTGKTLTLGQSDSNITIASADTTVNGNLLVSNLEPNLKMNFVGQTTTNVGLRVLNDGTVSFEGTAGQLFSVSNSLSGTIFSVNDISGIPSIEVLDTGLIKLNQYNGQTVIGSGTAVASAQLSAVARTSSTIPLVIKAATSQSVSIQEWHDSSGGVLGYISSIGDMVFQTKLFGSRYGRFGTDTAFTDQTILRVTAISTSLPTVQIKGIASQTSALQEWQNSSGTVVGSVAVDGAIRGNYLTNTTNTNPYIDISSGSVVVLNRNTASNTVFGVRGMASQSGSLQVWQNSTPTTIAYIDQAGSFRQTNSTYGYHYNDGSSTVGRIVAYSDTPSAVLFIARGISGQTGNLQEWQNNSGTILARVNSSGQFVGDGSQLTGLPDEIMIIMGAY